MCPGKYELVWHDEFNADTLDREKWIMRDGQEPFCFVDPLHGTCDFSHSALKREDNLEFVNGILRIRVDHHEERLPYIFEAGADCGFYQWGRVPLGAPVGADCYVSGEEYTEYLQFSSAVLMSKNRGEIYNGMHSFGKYEIRCKIPDVAGLWPSFWTWGGEEELDVFEFFGKTTEWGSNYHKWRGGSSKSSTKKHINFDTDVFHTFSLEWTPWKLEWQLDSQVVRQVHRYLDPTFSPLKPDEYLDCGDEFPKGRIKENTIFPIGINDNRKRLNFSVIVGCPIYRPNPPLSYESFPAYFEIDYIRVYAKAPNADWERNLCRLELIPEESALLSPGHFHTVQIIRNTENTADLLINTSTNLQWAMSPDKQSLLVEWNGMPGEIWLEAQFENYPWRPV